MKPKFCPYCGGSDIKFVKQVPRCADCRAVFIVSYSRIARKSPVKPKPKESK